MQARLGKPNTLTDKINIIDTLECVGCQCTFLSHIFVSHAYTLISIIVCGDLSVAFPGFAIGWCWRSAHTARYERTYVQ